MADPGKSAAAESLVRILNGSKYDQPPVGSPARRYVILSSQRTGSNYVCARLCNMVGSFGVPNEYFHLDALEAMRRRLRLPAPIAASGGHAVEIVEAVARVRTTADGYFGIKVQPQQLARMIPDLPLPSVPEGRTRRRSPLILESALHASPDATLGAFAAYGKIIILQRQDKLGQAISGAMAEATGSWMNGTAEAAIHDRHIPGLLRDVAVKLSQYIVEDRILDWLAARLGRDVLRVRYEDIGSAPEALMAAITAYLADGAAAAHPESTELVPTPQKPPGDFATRIRTRFLEYIDGSRPLPP